jgi:PAS domain-containing protein
MLGSSTVIRVSTSREIIYIAAAVVILAAVIVIARAVGRRSGRRAISQRLTSLGSRLGLDPPEDETNIETSLAYLEQVTSGAAQAVTESSSDAIRLRRSLDTLTQGVVLCDENGTVIYRNGRANALMVSRHGDALAAQAVTELLQDAWHEGTAERTLDLYGPPRRTLQVRARQIDDGRRPLGVIALIEDVGHRLGGEGVAVAADHQGVGAPVAVDHRAVLVAQHDALGQGVERPAEPDGIGARLCHRLGGAAGDLLQVGEGGLDVVLVLGRIEAEAGAERGQTLRDGPPPRPPPEHGGDEADHDADGNGDRNEDELLGHTQTDFPRPT